jgi:hypothetical protein
MQRRSIFGAMRLNNEFNILIKRHKET